MNSLRTLFGRLARDQSGAELAETAMLVGALAILALGAAMALGGGVKNVFNTLKNALNTSTN